MNRMEPAAYTRGPIGKTMLKTGAAMLAGTLAMSGYNLVDTYFVGQLGKTSLAAMGFTFPVIMLIGCVFHGLSIGVVTNSAQALGGGKKRKASKLVSSGLLLITLISIFLGIAGIVSVKHVFSAFGASGETLLQVEGYMNIWYFGCLTASLAMNGNNLLIACGESKTASAMMMGGMIVNALLDPLFIFGWGPFPAMGIRGAALATIGSQMLVAAAALSFLYFRFHLVEFQTIPLRRLRPEWYAMIRFAVPATIGMLLMPAGSAIITRVTAEFGDVAVAATAAAGRLEMFAFVFPMSLGISMLPMVGQNFGAKLYTRIRQCHRFAMNFAFLFLLGMAVLYFVFADWLVCLFSPDPEVRSVMALCMRIIPWGFGMIEIHRYSGFFFTGCGKPAAAAWLNALRILGLMVPLSLLALYFHRLEYLFWARLIADVVAGGVGWLLSYRLVHELPADGKKIQPKVFRSFLHPNRLRVMAGAQSDIDSRSDTQ